MPPGLDNLQHIVVLMMENRSFDHMLGSLKAVNANIDGIDPANAFSNPDTQGNLVKPQALAQFQAQLQPDPDHHFPAVDLQIFGGDTSAGRVANMQGFVKSYFNQQRDVGHSQKIMYYFCYARFAGTDDAGAGVCGVQPLVCVDSGADDLQPGVRALWDVVRPGGYESAVRE